MFGSLIYIYFASLTFEGVLNCTICKFWVYILRQTVFARFLFQAGKISHQFLGETKEERSKQRRMTNNMNIQEITYKIE